MKGIIFNLLEDVVANACGDATWEMLLSEASASCANPVEVLPVVDEDQLAS